MSVEGRLEMTKASGTLVSQLSETLRQAIAKGDHPPGSRLPSEAQLTATHGVSRTVVREAIAALRADRLVEARQGAGVFVLDTVIGSKPLMLSMNNIDLARVSSMIELLELRAAVEVEAAGLAALRRSPAQEEGIFDRHYAVRACLEAAQPTSEADFALHLSVAEATNNPRFREFLTMIGKSLIPRAALRPDDSEADQAAYIKLLDEEHNAIVVAISEGDEDGARQAMRRHLRGAQLRYRSLLRDLRNL